MFATLQINFNPFATILKEKLESFPCLAYFLKEDGKNVFVHQIAWYDKFIYTWNNVRI